VDYVAYFTDEIRSFVQALMQNSTDFAHSVRLILIEREPWRIEFKPTPQDAYGSRSKTSGLTLPAEAEWFSSVQNAPGDYKLDSSEFLSDVGQVHLGALSVDAQIEIVKDFARHLNADFDYTDNEIEKFLFRFNNKGSPLFATFVSLALISNEDTRDWELENLLGFAIKREQRNRWPSTVFVAEGILDVEDIGVKLAILPTILGGVNIVIPNARSKWLQNIDISAVIAAKKITGGNDTSATNTKVIPAFEPDILGEFFVADTVEKYPAVRKVIGDAWKTSRGRTLAFLSRVTKDFPNHAGMRHIVEFRPEDSKNQKALLNFLENQVVQKQVSERIFDVAAYSVLERSANSGHSSVEVVLGYCNMLAVGCELDLRSSVEWLTRSLLSGDLRAAALLGFLIDAEHVNRGELRSARHYYEVAAKGGSTFAMNRLFFADLPDSKHLRSIGAKPNFFSRIAFLLRPELRQRRFFSERFMRDKNIDPTGWLKKSAKLFEKEEKIGDFAVASPINKIDFGGELLSDAGKFYSALSKNQPASAKNLFEESATIYNTMSSLYVNRPEDEIYGLTFADCAASLLFDAALFFNVLAKSSNLDAIGTQAVQLPYQTAENAYIYSTVAAKIKWSTDVFLDKPKIPFWFHDP